MPRFMYVNSEKKPHSRRRESLSRVVVPDRHPQDVCDLHLQTPKNNVLIHDSFATPSLARMLVSDSEKEKRRLASSFSTNSALMSY